MSKSKFIKATNIVDHVPILKRPLLELKFDGFLNWQEISREIQHLKIYNTLGLVLELQNTIQMFKDFIPNANEFRKIQIYQQKKLLLNIINNTKGKILIINMDYLLTKKSSCILS